MLGPGTDGVLGQILLLLVLDLLLQPGHFVGAFLAHLEAVGAHSRVSIFGKGQEPVCSFLNLEVSEF
jgi:hypothetical protein